MLEYLPWIYDIMAALLLLCYISMSAKRGFASTVINFIGYVAALVCARVLSGMMAPALFDMGVRAGLLTKVQTALAEMPVSLEFAEEAATFLEALPTYVANLMNMGGFDTDKILKMLTDFPQEAASMLVDEVLAPVITSVIAMVLFLILFSALLFVVHSVSRFFGEVRRIPVIGPLNSALGGVVGLLTGAICLYVIVVLLRFVLMITGDSLTFLNQGLLDQTYTYKIWQQFEPAGILSTVQDMLTI